MAQLFGDFKVLENVTPRDSKFFGSARVSFDADKETWFWSYEIGSFDYIFGYYRGSFLAFDKNAIAFMGIFLMDDYQNPTGIVSSLRLTQEESQGSFYCSQSNVAVLMCDLILSNSEMDMTELEGKCDFRDR